MKRHATDLVSLVFGLIFLVAALWWYGVIYLDLNIDLPNFGWFLAGGLIVVGLIGVAASLRRDRSPVNEPEPPKATTVDATAEETTAAETTVAETTVAETTVAETTVGETPAGETTAGWPAEREQ